MLVALIFYSFSGNTRKVCEFLREKILQAGNQPDVVELELKEEETSFMRQGKAAQHRETPELTNLDYNASKYDFVIFASPVWAFTFTPALRTYLTKTIGLDKKKSAAILTCGAALTSGAALKELDNTLKQKGAEVKFTAYIAGNKTKDLKYLENKLSDLLLEVA
jgi:menaquinone-dependent protoporphyrinogen IX oxidase